MQINGNMIKRQIQGVSDVLAVMLMALLAQPVFGAATAQATASEAQPAGKSATTNNWPSSLDRRGSPQFIR